MRFVKYIISFLAVVALVLSGSAAANAASQSSRIIIQDKKLTDTGENAIKQLRRCLAETPTLNAYYLVDASGSLYGDGGTDPAFMRIDILKESMAQLSSLSDEGDGQTISVNYAMGVFGTNATPKIGWTPLNAGDLAEQQANLDANIRIEPQGWTNWPAGLQMAQESLNSAPGPSCSLLIWLTDGQIKFGDGPALEASATQELANLCGREVLGASPETTPGLFEQLRRSGVTVVGVMLDVTQADEPRKWWMQSLVEANDGQGRLCGQGEITKGERAGAFINANSPNDLSFQLLRLGAVVSGGADGTINPDGTFEINPGVTKFKILSQVPVEGLQLVSPSGAKTDLASVSKSTGGTTSILVPITDKKQFGKWQLLGAEGSSNSLLLYADLKIRPTALSVNDSETKGQFALSVAVGNDTLQNIEDYDFTISATTKVDGKFKEIGSFTAAEVASNKAIIKVSDPSKLGDVRFRIKGLQAGDQALSEQYRNVDFSLYPSVVTNYDFGISRGHTEPAQGTITVFGPSNGDGLICDDSKKLSPVVETDDANRTDWTLKSKGLILDSNGCIIVKQGTKTDLPITVISTKSANSKHVELSLPLHVSDSAGDAPLKSSLDITFSTQMINNPFVYWAVIIFLILLVLLIPLLVMYLINRLTTKIEHGDDVVRAVIPVQFTTKDDNILAANPGTYDYNTAIDKLDKPQELFKMQSPHADAKSITDSEVGTFKSVVPVMPFRSPWFELIAPAGFIALTGKTPTRLQENRYKLGNRAPFGGQISRTWVALVKEDDLLRAGDDPIAGKLVIFDKRGRGGSDRPKQRLLEVQHEAKLSTRLSNIRNAIQTAKPKKAKEFEAPKNDVQGPPVPPMPGGSVPGAVPPPPPGKGPVRPSVGGAPSAPSSPGFPPTPPTNTGSIPPPPPLPGKR
jgi:hypothetical protein